MEKMELYHIHKIGDHDKFWYENSLILVKENFKNTMYRRYQDFTTSLPIEGGGNIFKTNEYFKTFGLQMFL